MSQCVHGCHNSVSQTLDELDFERGLWYAALHNDIEKAEDLIRKGKNVNLEDKAGYTALHYASRNGHLKMCQLLIQNGANVNALTRSGKASSLHRCAAMGHTEIFKLLLESGASIDIKDGDGKTVLHRATEGGKIEIVQEILKINPALKKEPDNKNKLPEDYINNSSPLFGILH